MKVVTKVSEVKDIVQRGIKDPREVFPGIRKLAESEDWKVREVAATALVEISKKRRGEVIGEMLSWVEDKDANARGAAVEGLRDIARKDPEAVVPVLERAKADDSLYVRKSVANVLRNTGRKNPHFVLDLCRRWAGLRQPNTNWVIKDGLRRLKNSHPEKVREILEGLTK